MKTMIFSHHLKTSSITSLFLFSYSLLLTPLLVFLIFMNKSFIIEWEIISVSGTFITFPFILDPVGVSFSFIVCFISACVMMFSSSYMQSDPFLPRFIWLVMMFVFSMNALIFIPSLVSLLLGWDGLGIVSFALVVYYQNNKSLGAGMLTALANRIGDVALLTAIGLCVMQGHWGMFFMENYKFITSSSICILLAGMTKSAQVPFSSWLPAAMAAPTPVSALVHSSTLVTAGVFLLIRFFPFISTWQHYSSFLLFVSVTTLLMAGMSANYEFDMKKVIALSTLSQLGVMMMSLALGLPYLALFHLYTHALFKAMLFLCAGMIIHNNKNTQDLRMLGSLWKDMPLTISCLNIANLALCGAPFLSGFYSKDMILEMFLFSPCNMLILTMIFIATGMTSAYSLRLSFFSIWGQPNYPPCHQIYDEDVKSTFPMMFLSLMTVSGGAFLQYNLLDFNMALFLPTYLKLLTIFTILMGGLLSYYFSKKSFSAKTHFQEKQSFFSLMWFLVPISTLPIISFSMKTSMGFIKSLDQGWLEILGGAGSFLFLMNLSQKNQTLQKSTINLFLSMILFSIFVVVYFN
uniref:NADH dehydrogenase subunit 5 n=1 Tax=Gigantopelta aegis TaxID=1735272 RepID=UPI001EDCF023|nr:NADH dehydrogenase subunit 5 [Gigantopelta aegis]UFK31941.1 NADH dehydrogenase subunit 5 [Gigantopelta aegis]UKE79909.1 NADH dehydrogenase subunit 5 [Gigantopelta aegis]